MPGCYGIHKRYRKAKGRSHTSIVLRLQIGDFVMIVAVVIEDTDDHQRQCSNLELVLHLAWHTGLRWGRRSARMDPTVSELGKKSTKTGSSLPCRQVAGSPSMDPLVVSLVQQRQVPPGTMNGMIHMPRLG
jgi:hypothetical protein